MSNSSSLTFLSPVQDNQFEDLYLKVRELEGRLYSDEMVSELPKVEPHHSLYHEWQIRKSSADRLIKHIGSRNQSSNLLEIGCGNGWLCNYLYQGLGINCLGIDLNIHELKQAKRVFESDRLKFAYANVFDSSLEEGKYDAIVFEASIQYFGDIPMLLNQVKKLLSPTGKIYIIDSPIYESQHLVKEAKKRSEQYYQRMEVEELSSCYFHHCWDDFSEFDLKKIYNPASFSVRLLRKLKVKLFSPFPILEVRF